MSHKQTQDFGEFVEEAYLDIANSLWEDDNKALDGLILEYFELDEMTAWLEAKLTKDQSFFDGVIQRIWTDKKLGPELYELIAQDAEERYGYDECMEPEYSQDR